VTFSTVPIVKSIIWIYI